MHVDSNPISKGIYGWKLTAAYVTLQKAGKNHEDKHLAGILNG